MLPFWLSVSSSINVNLPQFSRIYQAVLEDSGNQYRAWGPLKVTKNCAIDFLHNGWLWRIEDASQQKVLKGQGYKTVTPKRTTKHICQPFSSCSNYSTVRSFEETCLPCREPETSLGLSVFRNPSFFRNLFWHCQSFNNHSGSSDIRFNLMAVVGDRCQSYEQKLETLKNNKQIILDALDQVSCPHSTIHSPHCDITLWLFGWKRLRWLTPNF